MTSSLGSIRYVSECQWGERRDTHKLSCFQAYDMWSYLDNVNVTRLLALSRYQMETGHFFDKNLVLKDWKMRFEELSCFYMFTSKGLDWTSGTLWLKDLSRTFRVQNEDGLMSFMCQLQKQLLYCTNVWDLLRDSLRILKMKPYRPNFPIYLLILVQLLEDQILCWASADASILFQAICLSDYQTTSIILQGPLLAESYIIQEKCIISKFNQKISKRHLNDMIWKSKIVLGCGPVFFNHSSP